MIGSAEIEELLAEHAEAQATGGSDPQPGAASTWLLPADASREPAAPSAPLPIWFWDPFALLPKGAG